MIDQRDIFARSIAILTRKKISLDHLDVGTGRPIPDECIHPSKLACWSDKTYEIAESAVEQPFDDMTPYESCGSRNQDRIIGGSYKRIILFWHD
jgi:hypothetical protein